MFPTSWDASLKPIRQIIRMRHWEELEFREIGKRLGRDGKTVWRWYQTAIVKMRS